jgi:inward rectifier potassium channel
MAFFQRKSKRTVDDPGFGYNFYGEEDRLIKKNGQFNVYRTGLTYFERVHAYQFLLDLSWLSFFTLVFSTFFFVNVGFASLYYWSGIEFINATETLDTLNQFKTAFFFSCQTLTTLGYGAMYPVNDTSNLIAAFESLCGFMFFAMVTGLLYGRFSRPRTRLRFSKNALISPFKDGEALMFRMANIKDNPFVEVDVKCFLSYIDVESKKRIFQELILEREHLAMMALNWTLVHPITQESPLNELPNKTLTKNHFELLIAVKGYDETYGQVIYTRTSYTHNDILVKKKFKPMVRKKEGLNIPVLDLSDIDNFTDAR